MNINHPVDRPSGPPIIGYQTRAGAPSHWRQRRESGSAGAFEGLHVVIVGKPPSPLDASKIALLISAGGGRVERNVLAPNLNLAVVSPSKSHQDKAVASLVERGVPCVFPQYLVDWVAHPSVCLSHHMMFG